MHKVFRFTGELPATFSGEDRPRIKLRFPSISLGIMLEMQKNVLGKTRLEVSSLGFGAAPIGYLDTKSDTVAVVLNTLLDTGVNLIDTCACYPHSEELIAEAVGHRREEYILVSKCGHPVEGVTGQEWSPELLSQTVERSLKRLDTDHLDIMLLHSCGLSVLQQGDALETLLKAQAAGKIRFVGYSGDNEAAVYASTLADVAVIETSINICDQVNIDAVLPKAAQNQIGILAKRPVANAAWKKQSQQPGLYKSYAKTYTERLAAMGITPADLGFDGEPAALWPRIALRFTLAQPGVHSALVGTTNLRNATENIAIAVEGPLGEQAVHKIRQAFQATQSQAGEDWLGLT